MNKSIKNFLLFICIALLFISFIRSDFKETKRNSKRIAENIKSFYIENLGNFEIGKIKRLRDNLKLQEYIIKTNSFYKNNSNKYKISVQIGTKNYFENYYNADISNIISKDKKLKINNERNYFIKKNLIRLYEIDDDIYLKVISDNTFFLIEILKYFLNIFLFSIIFIYTLLKLSKKFNFSFTKRIIDKILELKIEYYEIYIFIAIFGSVNLFFPDLSANFWYLFYLFVLIYLFLLFSKKLEFNFSKLKLLPILLSLIIFIILYQFLYNFGYMSSLTNESFVKKSILLLCLVPFTLYLLKKSGLNNLSIFLALIFSVSFIQFRSLSINVSTLWDLIFLNFLLFLNLYLLHIKYNNNFVNLLFFIVVLVISYAFAFRTDYIFLEEQGFHISYFIAPIVNQISDTGFRLLNDAPSQYGFLNLLIPSIINFKSGLNSFHIFQSSLLLLTLVIVFITIIKSKIKINKLFFFIFFSILLFLSDPYLIGPNPYPSSSVVRFFPVYLMILFVSIYSFDPFTKLSINKIILLGFILGITFLWSIEVFFYASFPFVIYFIFELTSNYNKDKTILGLKNAIKIIIVLSTVVLSILIVYKKMYSLGSVSLWMHYMHVFGYGKGYATVSLTPLTSALVLIIPLFILILNKSKINDFRIIFYIFLIFGMLSYFFGRAVPNNILALWPIYFLILGLLTSKFDNKSNNFLLIPIIIIISICQLSIYKKADHITYSKLNPSFVIDHKKIPPYTLYAKDFTDGLKEFSKSIPSNKKVSAITFGDFNKNLIRTDGNDIFLPSPWLLLASPLKIEHAKKILRSSERFKNSDGYIIYDKKWNYHYSELIKAINEIKKCNKVYNDKRFDTYYCESDFIN
tara:strand:- start:4168 stop:6741 length:2574 start_codon:yes stop_codon:yes gene_type:complete